MLTILLFIWRIFPGEVSRWHYDVHRNHLLNDNAAAALGSINKAIEWAPFHPRYWIARGGAEMELEDYDASAKSFDRAIELIQEFYPRGSQAIAIAQNNSAYARALGKIELNKAREDIDAALKVLAKEGAWLDTRGYVRLLQGELEGALEDTHSAVTQSESIYRAEVLATTSRSRDVVRRRMVNSKLRGLNEELVVLHEHRGLVFEALGQTDAAKRDFKVAAAYQAKANALREPPGN